MKKVLLFLVFLCTISCAKKEFKDLKPGTSYNEVVKDFGEPKSKDYLMGMEIWDYQNYFVILENNKVTRVYTRKEFDKYTKDLEQSFQQLEDVGKEFEQLHQQSSQAVKELENNLNKY